jgi:uncharacterized protein
MTETILWRRLDMPGHEAARLMETSDGWNLAGCALFSHEDRAVRLDYMIACDSGWRTHYALVVGWFGDREIHREITIDTGRRWTVNGEDVPHVSGCVDLDLNFSPSTNLLPIRRLGLAVGETASIRAAWLRFPTFTLEPLDQSYTRVSEDTYRYESGGGRFTAQLKIDASGFVTDYPPAWRAE